MKRVRTDLLVRGCRRLASWRVRCGVGLLGVVVGCGVSAGSGWERFLRDPDATSFAVLSAQLKGAQCDWGGVENKEIVPDEVRERMFAWMEKGNEYAFAIGLMTIECFDGGDLEDLYRSGGVFLDVKPRLFLEVVSERGVPAAIIRGLSSHLPIDDDPAGASTKAERRAELLRGVQGEEVANARAESLSALAELVQFLRDVGAAQRGEP